MSSPRSDNRIISWLVHGLPLLPLLAFPWLLGGQWLEVQLAGLAVSLAAFALSLTRKRRSITPPLVLVFCLAGYLWVQYTNPAYLQEWQTGLRIWHLEPVEFTSWLPSSIRSDFTDASPLRFLVIVLTPCFCALAIYQFSRRFDRRVLLPLLVLNTAAISLVGLIQVIQDSRSILGLFAAVDEGLGLFFGTLLYKNHAAALFNLGLAGSLAGFFAYNRNPSFRRSNPSGLFLVAAVVLVSGVIFSRSRFGFLCTLGILTVFAPPAFAQAKQSGLSWKWLFAGIGLLIAMAAGGGFYLLNSHGARHLTTLNAEIVEDFSYKQRALAYRSAWNMFREKPLFGWGAGNFRHGFRQFQDLETEAEQTGNAFMERRNQTFFWQHAHNDYLEWLIELGVAGTLLLFAIPGYFFWRIIRSKHWKAPLPLLLLAGLGNTLAHALVDFPFRNSAVLLTWSVLLVITAKQCEGKERS